MTQELDTDFNQQIKTVQEKRVSAEAQMEVGMIWFKYLANNLPFYGLSEFVENEDVWFDSIFSKPPVDTSTSFVHGTLFYNAIQVLLKSFTKNVPANKYDIRSRIHFNKDGSGESLNSIVNVLILAYREFHVIKYMLKNLSLLKDFYADFLFCMAGILENNFTKNPAEDLDLVMNCEVFIRLVTIFQDKLPLLYYRQMTGSFLYQQHIKLMLGQLNSFAIDFNKLSDINYRARHIEKLAIEMAHKFDASIRKDTPAYGLKIGAGPGSIIPGRVLLNNAFFAFQNDNADEIFDTYVSNANGVNFTVHLVKSRNLSGQYQKLEKLLQVHINEVATSIFKLKTKQEDSRRFVSYSGLLDVHNIYRKNLEDTNFFNVNEVVDAAGNKFTSFLLIDNSCSIPGKINTLQQVIVLLTSVISKHTDIFPNLFAYAQKGTNKAVYLTPLVEGSTRSITNWGNLLFFNCNKVNYDPYALHEILRKNERELQSKNKIPLVFIVGDAWPVSLEKDAKEEGTQIMRQLREKYPKMVIIYFATNAQYNPEQLGYDYYIKLNSDYFSFESFKVQFQQVILKVIQDHVFNKSN